MTNQNIRGDSRDNYRRELADKPGSVVDSYSSGSFVTKRLKQPTRIQHGQHKGSLFGLAPGGVYHAVAVTSRAVRSYRTISPLPSQ